MGNHKLAFALMISASLLSCSSTKPPIDTCQIGPRSAGSTTTDTSQKVAADLQKLTVAPINVTLENKFKREATSAFQKIPENNVVCQMLLQTVACIQRRRDAAANEMADRLITFVFTNPSCQSVSPSPPATQPPASTPPQSTSERVLIAKDMALSVGGCESRATHFRVTASGRVDRSKGGAGGAPPGFDFEIRGNNPQGVRNIQLTAETVLEFDVYADGPGTRQSIPLGGSICVGGEGANVSVDVYAWVFQQ